MEKKNNLPDKIKITIDASHSGLVNGNLFMYLPDGMKGSGEASFVKPYNKPITDGHPLFFENEKETPVLGRIIDAKYESYDLFPEMDSLGCRDEDIVDTVQKAYRMQMSDEGFKGLGQMTVTAEITDKNAIEQIMDKRKLTVSIGAFIDNARCSVCGTKWGNCGHELNNSYDGKVAFRVAGKMKFDHVAFVKRPADENAMVSNVETIKDSSNPNADGYTIMVYDEVQIMTTEFDSKEEKPSLKSIVVDAFTKMIAGTDDRDIKTEVSDTFTQSAEKGRQHSFLFTDTKEVYLKDKLGLVVAKIVVDEIEETEENKTELLALKEVIDTLVGTKRFIDISDNEKTCMDIYTDFLQEAKTVEDNNQTEDKVVDNLVLSQQTIDSIADAVYNKIKNESLKTDGYTKDRLKSLELAIIELEDKLLESDKEMVSFANKSGAIVEDVDAARNFFQELEDKSTNDSSDEGELQKLDLNDNIIEDRSIAETEVEEGADLSFDIGQVGDTYRDILKDKGFVEAKKYLKELKDNGKIPDNFIL